MFSQYKQNGIKWVIAYGNHSLNEHEKNYCNAWMEMLDSVTYIDCI